MDPKYRASAKSDEELLDTIENRQLYLPETIEASLEELKSRGHIFTETELSVIEEDVQAHRNNAALSGRRIGFANGNYKNNIIQDPDAPSLYSRQAIYGFTVFFGALFGSIMMAINFAKTKNHNNIVWVLLFGALYTTIQVIIVQSAHTGSSLTILFSIISAFILESFFWNRFIGNATFYRLKPIWIPLIIGIILSALIIISIIYSPQ